MSEVAGGVKRLADYGKLHKESPEYLSLDDILDHEVVVKDVEWFEGTFGKYAVMVVDDKGKEVKVRSGASLVVDALMDADFQNAFPLAVTFHKRGRTYRFS